jgi:hypothetical protein
VRCRRHQIETAALVTRVALSLGSLPGHWRKEANDVFTKKGDAAVLAKLADGPAQFREMGERLHEIIRESAPSLEPIVRWGLPFYVGNGKDICFIKPGKDFIAFGFGEDVNPTRDDAGSMHPVAWTLTSLDDATEDTIRALVRRAAR